MRGGIAVGLSLLGIVLLGAGGCVSPLAGLANADAVASAADPSAVPGDELPVRRRAAPRRVARGVEPSILLADTAWLRDHARRAPSSNLATIEPSPPSPATALAAPTPGAGVARPATAPDGPPAAATGSLAVLTPPQVQAPTEAQASTPAPTPAPIPAAATAERAARDKAASDQAARDERFDARVHRVTGTICDGCGAPRARP